jgi:predicted RecA/RadA family phage recombinase
MPFAYISSGDRLDHIPATDLPLGSVVVQGELVAIADLAIPAGAFGSLALSGIFDLPRATGVAVAVGTAHFWDATNQRVTTDADGGANARLGVNVLPAVAAASTIRILLGR